MIHRCSRFHNSPMDEEFGAWEAEQIEKANEQISQQGHARLVEELPKFQPPEDEIDDEASIFGNRSF